MDKPRNLAVDTPAVKPLVTHARHVEDALAEDPELFQFLDDSLQNRLGHAVHLPEERLLAAKEGERSLLPSQVRYRRRQTCGHEGGGLSKPPASGTVRVRQAFFKARFLELVQAVEVGGVLPELGPRLHPVGRRHVHEDLDGGTGGQGAKEALQDSRHLHDRSVGYGADVSRLHLPDAPQARFPRVPGLLEEQDAVFRTAYHRAVRQERRERPVVFVHQVEHGSLSLRRRQGDRRPGRQFQLQVLWSLVTPQVP